MPLLASPFFLLPLKRTSTLPLRRETWPKERLEGSTEIIQHACTVVVKSSQVTAQTFPPGSRRASAARGSVIRCFVEHLAVAFVLDQSGMLKVRYDDFLQKKHANVHNGLRIGSPFELP